MNYYTWLEIRFSRVIYHIPKYNNIFGSFMKNEFKREEFKRFFKKHHYTGDFFLRKKKYIIYIFADN